jgi:hypothetical protein
MNKPNISNLAKGIAAPVIDVSSARNAIDLAHHNV